MQKNLGDHYPKVSIIIVNLNGKHDLKCCLPSIFLQEYPNFEVIVVDNASTDGSIDYLVENFPKVKIFINEKNLGYAGANNVGFNNSTGELIAVLNPDTKVDPSWMIELVCNISEPKIGMVTPKILLMDEPDRINTCGNEITYSGLTFCRGLGETKDRFNKQEIVSAISGAAFVIKKSVLDHIGGFDESFFMYYEDTDLSLRAALAGYTCLYVPTSIVYHKYIFKFSPMKTYYQERNRYFSLLKTLRWQTILALTPSLIIAEMVAWGYAVLNGPQHIRNKFCAYTWLIGNISHVADARKQVQALRKVDDRAILDRFGYRLNFTWTVKPWLAKILDKSINPFLYIFSRFSKLLINW